MTENKKNLALGLAKVKVDKLVDWYYIKRSPLLKDFDKEALLGKIIFDLLELRGILDGCIYNPFDEQEKAIDEADKRKEVDLEHLEQAVKDFCYEYDDRKEKWYELCPNDKKLLYNPTWANFAMSIAKHFFKLGLKAQKGK